MTNMASNTTAISLPLFDRDAASSEYFVGDTYTASSDTLRAAASKTNS